MADQKISALTELTSLANDDEFVVVDKSDTSQAASGTTKRVTRANLASVGMYRSLVQEAAFIGSGIAANTFILSYKQNFPPRSGTEDYNGAAIPTHKPLIFTASDYAVSGFTQKLNVAASVAVADTAPGITFTFGLYPFTVAGATTHVVTLGTVVSGSTVAIATPGANAVTTGTSGDFTIPSDGNYLLGVVTSGTTAANSRTALSATLRHRLV